MDRGGRGRARGRTRALAAWWLALAGAFALASSPATTTPALAGSAESATRDAEEASERLRRRGRTARSRRRHAAPTPPTARPTMNPAQAAAASAGYNQQAVVNTVNAARARVGASDMVAAQWNYALEALIRENATADPAWFYAPNTKYEYPIRGEPSWHMWNGMYLMEYPEFARFKAMGFTYLFHDTDCGSRCIPTIFSFRLRQSECFDYANCNAKTFDQFESCASPLAGAPSNAPSSKAPTTKTTKAPTAKRRTASTPPADVHVGSRADPCAWWWQYYPWLVRSDLSQIACAELPYPGKVNLHHQPASFFCYGVVTAPSNDLPYLTGAACSKCPAGFTSCDAQGLCVAAT